MSGPQLTGTDCSSWTLITQLSSIDRARAIEDAVTEVDPDVALAEIDALPGGGSDAVTVVLFDDDGSDWLPTITDLVAAHPEVRPVLLAHLDRPELFLGAMMAGVVGFCDAEASVDAIVRTINSVRRSGVAIPRTLVPPLVAHLRDGHGYHVRTPDGTVTITNREWQILVFLMQRRTTGEMAEALFVSPGTVRSHVSALLKKLGAADRDDAIDQLAAGELELLDSSTVTH